MKKNLSDKVYSLLREDVFGAKYNPNELISERQIADKYNVSKLTAGEALHRLCAEGHLTSYPRSGYMVTALSPLELQQVKSIRYAMESLAVEQIILNATDEQIQEIEDKYIVENPETVENPTKVNAEFHLALAHATDNKFLIKYIEDLLGSISRVEQHIPLVVMKTWQDDHVSILRAIKNRDYEAAKKYLKHDVDNAN